MCKSIGEKSNQDAGESPARIGSQRLQQELVAGTLIIKNLTRVVGSHQKRVSLS